MHWGDFTISHGHPATIYRILVLPEAAADASPTGTGDGLVVDSPCLDLIDD